MPTEHTPQIIPGRLRLKMPIPRHCPGCEEENVSVIEENGVCYVRCPSCAMQGPHVMAHMDAIVAWNDIKR